MSDQENIPACHYCGQRAQIHVDLSREVNPETGDKYESEDEGPYGNHARGLNLCCVGMRFGTIDLCENMAEAWAYRAHIDTFIDENGRGWRDMTVTEPSNMGTWTSRPMAEEYGLK